MRESRDQVRGFKVGSERAEVNLGDLDSVAQSGRSACAILAVLPCEQRASSGVEVMRSRKGAGDA